MLSMYKQALACALFLSLSSQAEDPKRCVCPPRIVDLCTAAQRRTVISVAPIAGSGLMTVPVAVATSPKAPFFIDISEARTKVAARFLTHEGYSRHRPAGSSKKEAFSAVTPSVLAIGNQIWTYPRLLVDEQRDLGKAGAAEVAGVLGNDLLSQTEFLLDLRRNQIVFFFTRDPILPRIQNVGVRRLLLVKEIANSLAISGTIKGKPVAILVSTSDTSAVLNPIASQVLGGASSFELSIGDVSLPVPSSTVSEIPRFSRVKADKEAAMVLPTSLLKGKILYFSPATRSAYLADAAACDAEPKKKKF